MAPDFAGNLEITMITVMFGDIISLVNILNNFTLSTKDPKFLGTDM